MGKPGILTPAGHLRRCDNSRRWQFTPAQRELQAHHTGEIRLDKFCASEVHAGEVGAGEIREGEVCADEVRIGEVCPCEICVGEGCSSEVRLEEVRLGESCSSELRAPMRVTSVRSALVRSILIPGRSWLMMRRPITAMAACTSDRNLLF